MVNIEIIKEVASYSKFVIEQLSKPIQEKPMQDRVDESIVRLMHIGDMIELYRNEGYQQGIAESLKVLEGNNG